MMTTGSTLRRFLAGGIVLLGLSTALRAQTAAVLIEKGATWRFFKGAVAPPADWTSLDFADDGADWLSGPSGIGYGDTDDATVLDDMQMAGANPGYMAFFARYRFNVPSLDQIDSLILEIDYDDGFVAYLNGVEVARRGLGNTGDLVAFDAPAVSREAGTPEYLPLLPGDLVAGDNMLAIELHNAALESTDASLIPILLANVTPPPTGFTCAVEAQGVRLTWTNGGVYDGIRVERNGSAVTTLPGTAMSYLDTSASPLDNTYRVVGVVSDIEVPSTNCAVACTQGTLTCSLALVGGVTHATLSWGGVPDVTSVTILREGVQRVTLTSGETTYVDTNVEDQEPEDDTDYTVILTTSSGSTCTLACGHSLCPTLSVSAEAGQAILTIGNVVKAWDHFELSRNGQIIEAALPPTTTSYTDTGVVLEVGDSYDYLLHPIAVPGGELPAPGIICDAAFTFGYVPELGEYDVPAGGWDYKIDFDSEQDDRYEPVAGTPGNLDGNWIRALDIDQWNGRGPDDAPGPAPAGPAPGGLDVRTRTGQGSCGVGNVSALRVLDPGDTSMPIGTTFPTPFDPPANSRIFLGYDLGITDQNVLRSGVTFSARIRLSPDAPAYMNAVQASGDGSPIAGGLGMVGIYFRADGSLPGEGSTAAASFSLESGANGGNLDFSVAGQDIDASQTLKFISIWATIVGGAAPDTYDVRIYVNGAITSSTEVGGDALTLVPGAADFGPNVSNYLAIGSADTPQDAMFEVDYVAYKLGVHEPTVTACSGDAPQPPTNLAAAPSNGKVTLSWTAPTAPPAPSNYAVFRDGTRIVTVSSLQTTYDDTGLVNGTEHCYRVRSIAGLLESLDSDQVCATPTVGGDQPVFHRGDADDNGQLQLTDAIRILGVLFLGQGQIPCNDAADADDNGQLQLTDAIRVLGVLFLGQGTIPDPGAPFTGTCGEDPTPDVGGGDLGCASYGHCN